MDDRWQRSEIDYTPVYGYDPASQRLHWRPIEPDKVTFSRQEVRELALAVGLLTLAFTLARRYYADTLYELGVLAFTSFCAIVSAFLFHELGHKFLAQRYHCWAEFRAWKRGLFMALLFSMFGFVFAAPGAVYIHGYLTTEQNGKVSAIGPGTNIMVGGIATIGLLLVEMPFLNDLFYLMAYINLFLAGFNMLPIPPMDGSKIWRWDKGVYVLMFVLIGFLFIVATNSDWVLGLI